MVGYLVYLSTRDVLFFRASFSPIFPGPGCQNKAIFLEPIVKHVKRGNFARSGHYIVQFLCFGVYFSPTFSRIGYHLKAKILELGNIFFP